MLKVKVHQIVDSVESGALERISPDPTAKVTVKLTMRRVWKKVKEVYGEYLEDRADLLDEYAQKGEDGKPLTDTNRSIQFPTREAEKAFKAEIKKLRQKEISINARALEASDFRKTETGEPLQTITDQQLADVDWLLPDSLLEEFAKALAERDGKGTNMIEPVEQADAAAA